MPCKLEGGGRQKVGPQSSLRPHRKEDKPTSMLIILLLLQSPPVRGSWEVSFLTFQPPRCRGESRDRIPSPVDASRQGPCKQEESGCPKSPRVAHKLMLQQLTL